VDDLDLYTLTLFLGWRCSIKCSHCGFSCGPDRSEQLDSVVARTIINEVRDFDSLRMVAYSGGEPLMYKEELVRCMESASQNGFTGGLVTNCSWATSKGLTIECLQKLKSLGLEEIILSLDEFHLAHVPLSNIRRVAKAAISEGIRLGINMVRLRSHHDKKEDISAMLETNFENLPKESYWLQESSPLLFGRAENFFAIEDLQTYPLNYFLNTPCQYIVRNIVLTPEQELYACCGLGGATRHGPAEITFIGNYSSGNFQNLFEKARSNLLFNIVANYGPAMLLTLAHQHDTNLEIRQEYASACDICGEISTNSQLRQAVKASLLELATLAKL